MSVKPEEVNVQREDQIRIPDQAPVLPLPELVAFPFMIAPLLVNRDRSVKAVDQALAQGRMMLMLAQKQPGEEDPPPEELYTTGTVAIILRMLKMPDQGLRILAQGIARARVSRFVETE